MQQIFYIKEDCLSSINSELKRYNDAKIVQIVPIRQEVSAGSSMYQKGEWGAYVVIDYK